MCYPLPGPRCTPHTRAAVISAQRAFSANPTPEAQARLNEAQREYDKSPEGLERNRQLVEYNIRHGIKTRKTLTQLQEDETERNEGIAAMKALGITVKSEDEPTPFDETGRDIRGFDVSGVNSNGDTVAQAEANLLNQNIDEKEYQLLKELGHRNWTAEDRENIQKYDTAKKALDVVRAGSFSPNLSRASDPTTDKETLNSLSSSADDEVRLAVANHPNVSYTALTQLTHDENLEVKEIAYNRISGFPSARSPLNNFTSQGREISLTSNEVKENFSRWRDSVKLRDEDPADHPESLRAVLNYPTTPDDVRTEIERILAQ